MAAVDLPTRFLKRRDHIVAFMPTELPIRDEAWCFNQRLFPSLLRRPVRLA